MKTLEMIECVISEQDLLPIFVFGKTFDMTRPTPLLIY
jgi:hypothetical protein